MAPRVWLVLLLVLWLGRIVSAEHEQEHEQEPDTGAPGEQVSPRARYPG